MRTEFRGDGILPHPPEIAIDTPSRTGAGLVSVVTSMLCKAISIQKNEDFLGDIHIDLARILIQRNKLAEAKNELNIYKEHRNHKNWKLSEEFEALTHKVKDVEASVDNSKFHESNIRLAEEYIYRYTLDRLIVV